MKPMCIVLIRSCWSLGTEAWHTLTRDHTVLPATHTFIHKWNELYLPLNSSRRASPHFGWYSFLVPLRVGGWVGLCGLVKYWGCSARPKTVTHPSIRRSSRELNPRPWSRESNDLTTRLPRECELVLCYYWCYCWHRAEWCWYRTMNASSDWSAPRSGSVATSMYDVLRVELTSTRSSCSKNSPPVDNVYPPPHSRINLFNFLFRLHAV